MELNDILKTYNISMDKFKSKLHTAPAATPSKSYMNASVNAMLHPSIPKTQKNIAAVSPPANTAKESEPKKYADNTQLIRRGEAMQNSRGLSSIENIVTGQSGRISPFVPRQIPRQTQTSTLAPEVTDETRRAAADRYKAASAAVEAAIGMNTPEERQAAYDEYNAASEDYKRVFGTMPYRTPAEAATYLTELGYEAIPRALDLADNSVQKGVTGIASIGANLADMTVGNIIKGVGKLAGKDTSDNIISRSAQQVRDEQRRLSEETYRIAQGNPILIGASDIISSTIQAIPMAVAAYFTGGTSLAQSAAGLTASANLIANPTVTNTISYYANAMMQNPNYWASVMQEAAGNYQDALEWAKSPEEAALYATTVGLINGGVEIGLDGASGIQGFEQSIRDGNTADLRAFLDSIVDEGKEEIVQGQISRAIAGIMGSGAPMFSLTDENAVINPVTSAKEGLAGAAVAALLQGGQTAIQGAVERSANIPTQTQKNGAGARIAPSVTNNAPASENAAESVTGGNNAPQVFTSPNVNDSDGLGAADANFSPLTRAAALGAETYPVNATAAERVVEERGRAPMELPVENPNTGKNISKIASTILNSPITSNDMAPVIEENIVRGLSDYDKVGNRQAVERAQARTQRDGGYTTAAEEFIRKVDLDQRITHNDIVQAIVCYNEAVAAGDDYKARGDTASANKAYADALDLYNRIRLVGTTDSQVLQAFNLFNRLTPEGKLLSLRRYIDRLNANTQSKTTRSRANTTLTTEEARQAAIDRYEGIVIPEDLATDYLMAETDEERTAAWNNIIRAVADQQPATFAEKWNAWRYFAMLSSPTTHVRNTIGNVVRAGVGITADTASAALQSLIIKDPTQRTKAILTPKDAALREFAKGQYETDKAAALGGGKYSSESSGSQFFREINEVRRRQTFSNPNWKNTEFGQSAAGQAFLKAANITQAAANLESDLLDAEDVLFNKPAYTRAFASALKAKGVTAEEAAAGLKANLVEEARRIAIRSAQEYTFRETSEFSNYIASLGRNRNTPLEKAAGLFWDANLAFRRTPANIMKQGVVDFSPIGLTKAITVDAVKVRNGTMTAGEMIDNLTKGLTGSAIFALGIYLARNGILKRRVSEDDRENEYLTDAGYQGFSVELGDKSYTLEWLTPASMPLFAGAAIGEANEDMSLTSIMSALGGMSDVILETSMLSSLDFMLDHISYSENKPWYLVSKTITSYLSQGIPAILGRIASASDDKVRQSYVTPGTDSFTSDVQYFIQKSANKTPGARQTLQPKIDMWGNEVSNGSTRERVIEAFISPGYYSTARNSAVDKEVQRLAGIVGSDVYPTSANKTFKYSRSRSEGGTEHNESVKINLDAEQFTEYSKVLGKTRYDIIDEMIKSDAYKALPDDAKADVIDKAYSFAEAKAKAAVSDYAPSDGSWITKAEDNPAEYILNVAKYGADTWFVGEKGEAAKEVAEYGVTLDDLYNGIDSNNKSGISQGELADYLAKRTDLNGGAKQMIWNALGDWKTSYRDYAKSKAYRNYKREKAAG